VTMLALLLLPTFNGPTVVSPGDTVCDIGNVRVGMVPALG